MSSIESNFAIETPVTIPTPTPAQYKLHNYAIFVLQHLQTLNILPLDFDPFALDTQILSDYNPTKFANFIKNKNKNKNSIIQSPKPNILHSIVDEFYSTNETENKPVKKTKKEKNTDTNDTEKNPAKNTKK